jgi:hypothetical protein
MIARIMPRSIILAMPGNPTIPESFKNANRFTMKHIYVSL